MNYACAFLGGILIFALVSWYAGGRKHYTGPLTEAQVTGTENVSNDSSSDDMGSGKIEGYVEKY